MLCSLRKGVLRKNSHISLPEKRCVRHPEIIATSRREIVEVGKLFDIGTPIINEYTIIGDDENLKNLEASKLFVYLFASSMSNNFFLNCIRKLTV